MPAEWEPRAATWLVWPTDPETFPPTIIANVERTYVEMIQALREGEKVNLLVDDEATAEKVTRLAGAHRHFVPRIIKTQDVWIRDYGPTFVTNGKEVAMVVWRYNAYGEKWPELMVDDRVPDDMNHILNLKKFDAGICIEGGAIEVNGKGTCLVTESALIDEKRNPGLDRAKMEEVLRNHLSVSRIIWMAGGVVSGDDTDGHIDNIARFVNASTVLCAFEKNVSDENHATLKKNFETLKREARDQDEKPIDVIPLPMPGPVANTKSGRLPASYANFYIGKNVVLLPTYAHTNDDRAKKILQEFFPTRDVIGIDARFLVWGFGSIHCVTQQEPLA